MSRSDHPDRDSLTGYLDDSLSIDAAQWVRQHLKSCADCRDKLERERRLSARLDGLRSVKPPADFTEGVMARVAQYPAYQPGKELPWGNFARWGGIAAAAVLVLAVFIGWIVVAGGGGQGVQVPAGASAFTIAIDGTVWAYETAAAGFETVAPQLQDLFSVAYVVYEFIRDAGLPVHLALLLVTVGLNYALTRMVLNYQRRQ